MNAEQEKSEGRPAEAAHPEQAAMEKYFGPRGVLASKVEGFEPRAGQIEMARAVFEAFRSRATLMAEAGTGTGKTWAYLVPAMLCRKKVVVSTGTKTLQDQILDHDIPFLKKNIDSKLKVVCLKGRRNYLCRRRFLEFCYQPTIWAKDEATLFRRFQKWAATSNSGDRSEIHWLPDNFRAWNDVCSSSEYCLGRQCPEFSRCHLTRVRLDAARADIVVVNHHLFFADMALRIKGLDGVIPEYEAVVFDEAHQLEDVAGEYFGLNFSSFALSQLSRDILKGCGGGKNQDSSAVQAVGRQLEVLSRLFVSGLAQPGRGAGRLRFDPRRAANDFDATCAQIVHALGELPAMVKPFEEKDENLACAGRRAGELSTALTSLLEQKDQSLVYWQEATQQGVFLRATPIAIGPILSELLFATVSSVVMTSATLSVAGAFDFVRNSLGVPAKGRELLVPSPFEYGRQAIAYIPVRFPAPNEASFCARMAEEAAEIIEKTRGRTLLLFTSYKNMHEVHKILEGKISFPLLVQGQKTKRALLQEFKDRVESVLCATSSFWQGIDVPGEALSCVIIDKLPFEVPDDPVTASRLERIAGQGGNGFYDYQVPRAAIQLKQGIGRLIRSSGDRGVIAVFDIRMMTKSYGQVFVKSLPPCPIVHHLDQIDTFWKGS
ncbi:MAG: ATP-dependent DNA helicase [Syntrophobacteraceae bacterium]|nr:ATP-dependent DNA helicase [Syntrophobacteraceae bacterium]